MILNIENPKEFTHTHAHTRTHTHTQLELTNEFSKVVGYKMKTQK